MKQILFPLISLLTVLILSFISCDTNDPPTEGSLTLKLEDVSCTEAWIELRTTNLQLPTTLTLKQTNPSGDSKSQTLNLITQDSLLYIDSLLPNQTYQYQISSIENPAISNELRAKTMDTTSHNFAFETFTFGGTAGSSTLYDVAIINENNIWAVGEIYVADTSQNGNTLYNAVHWDGTNWEFKKITVNYRGNLITPSFEGVFAFSSTDIWFVGSLPIHGDGQNWIMYDLRTTVDPNVSLLKAWGTSSDNIYFVGRNGNVVWKSGNQWTKIESGTNLIIRDVWGVNKNNVRKVFCTVLASVQSGEHKILTIDENNIVDSLHWDTGRIVTSSWSPDGKFVYTSGWGVFNNKSGRWVEERTIPLFYTNRIRGNALNDIVVVGNYGFLAHYNGVGWKVYDEFLQLSSADFYSISVEGGIMVAVGYYGESSLIVTGRKI